MYLEAAAEEEEEEDEDKVEDVICTRETNKSQTSLGFVEFAFGKDHNLPF